jgi:dTDP-4-dehydrorhamnose reductase
MLRLGRERNHVSVVNDQLGTPTYAQDLANAIIKTLPHIARNECSWGVYHYAGGTVISWYEFAQEIFAAATARDMQTPQEISVLSTAEYPTAAPRPACSALSTELFSQTFGVQASDWHKGIQTTLAKINDQQADQ